MGTGWRSGTHQEETPVLVVGGGLVGLATAVFLAHRDVPVIVAERRSDTLIHPRARTINPRSVELLRQVGLEEAVLAECAAPGDSLSILLRAETLDGPERFRAPLDRPAELGDLSPCQWARIDQDRLELLLQRHAERLGADLRFHTEADLVAADADGVTVALRDRRSGRERIVHSDYLVAADGNRSSVRHHRSIGTHGQGTIGHTLTFTFDADLTGPLRGRHIGVCHLDRPASGTVLLPHDGVRRWVFSTPYHPDRGERLEDFDEARCVALVRAAIGIADLDVSIVAQLANGTTVLGYEVAARVADRFQDGRVFLVGDAAHVMPPTGAFGASTGIADAHNLAWKLAAVLHKQAGASLLATYDAERRPVAELTVNQALLQLRSRTEAAPAPGAAPFVPLNYYATVFGYRYRSTAVPGPVDDTDPEVLAPDRITGQPGFRAPHARLDITGERSVLDLFGDSFVLLAGPADGGWLAAAATVADRLEIPLRAYRSGAGSATVWRQNFGVGPTGAVLVRPDGFVAWRVTAPPANPVSTLDSVLRGLLSRGER
jgi:putative polyketide hydroxylase